MIDESPTRALSLPVRPIRPRLIRLAVAGALAAALVSISVGCSDDEAADETEATTTAVQELPELSDSLFVESTGVEAVDIDVIDNSFEERYVTVSAGTTVTWTNNGEVEHNVTPSVEGQFAGVDSDGFGPGSVHSVTFDEPGEYQYYCTIHGTPRNGQTGAIRVVA